MQFGRMNLRARLLKTYRLYFKAGHGVFGSTRIALRCHVFGRIKK